MKILCLANSFRVGGRCVGGIELNQDNIPILQSGRPKWVRPVFNAEHEEVPVQLVSGINLLDVVEFDELEMTGHDHQTENVLFNSNTIKTVGRLDIAVLERLIDNDRYASLFGNRGAAVPEEKIGELSYSLSLVLLEEFETNERVFEGKPYPQIKLSFRYRGNPYNFPITDPVFLDQYKRNNGILNGRNRIYATLSLAAPHQEWSSKLVAGIIIGENSKAEVDDFDISDFS